MRCFGRFSGTGALALVVALGLSACGGDDDDDDAADGGDSPDASSDGDDVDAAVDAAVDAGLLPRFRNPVDTPDEELGVQVLSLFGAPIEGAQTNCDSCHGMTQENLRVWSALSQRALSDCLTDLEPTDPAVARTMIDCLRADPADPESTFKPEKLGVYSTGAHLPWFASLFDLAYGAGGPEAHDEFVQQMDMPRDDLRSITQGEFDQIAEYYDRRLPRLAELLPNEPDPEGCVLDVSEDVATYVLEMETSGWRAVNTDANMLMYGCGGADTARDCLTDETRVEEWEAMPGSVIRQLAEVDYSSAFWTRSSADGRFVAHGVQSGLGASAAFIDLQNGGKIITADALYDPGFFPDNSGFAFQPPASFCQMSVLNASPDSIDFTEPGCSTVGQVGLYQHIGASLRGGDFWAVDSQFVGDNGGHSVTDGDPSAGFSSNTSSLTPMVFDGAEYVAGESITVSTPNEGDTVLSPSARLLITRVRGSQSRQSGFNLRRIDATVTPDGYDIEVPRIARYCVNGGKPGFSFDERWIAYHHYVEASDAVDLGFDGPDDPAFQPYLSQGAANIYLMELTTGQVFRVTGMAPGEYALYPHFRSDGWIYFLVRQPSGSTEIVAASDAALVLEN